MNLIERLKLKIVKVIIWDFDGTLYESKEIGIDLKKYFYTTSKITKTNLTLKEFENISKDLGSWSAACSKISKIDELKVLDECDKKVIKSQYIKENKNIVSFIERTKNKYKHLVFTNSTEKQVIDSLEKIGFKSNPFIKIYSRDNTHLLKPDNKILKKIHQYTKIPKIFHLCIGDSISSDIKPSLEYGFQAIPIWEIYKLG